MKQLTAANLIAEMDQYPIGLYQLPVTYIVSVLRQYDAALNEEKNLFVNKGVKEDYLQLALPIADELVKRNAEWLNLRFESPEIKAKWKSLYLQVYDLRHDLLLHLIKVCEDNSDAMKHLKNIRKNRSKDELIQDIYRLVDLAKNCQEELTVMGWDEKKLQDTVQLATEMANTQAEIKVSVALNKAKSRRDCARSLAWDYINDLRDYADIIHAKNPKARARYHTHYEPSHIRHEEDDPKDPQAATVQV